MGKYRTMQSNTGEGKLLNGEAIFSEERFNEIIGKIDQDDWILANIARLVYYAGFHRNEVENVKIGNVRQGGAVVSEIEPFLPRTRKTYSYTPIILNDESKRIVEDHINKLTNEGYHINAYSPLFPDKKSKQQYVTRTLTRQFKKYFGKITFNNLRAYGIQRRQKQLEGMHLSADQRKKELLNISRHSRSRTTKELIDRDVQKAGKLKKKDLPWERIVRSIERLPLEFKKEETFKEYLKNIQDNISKIKKNDVRESLNQLLKYSSKEYLKNGQDKTSKIKENDAKKSLNQLIRES